AGALGLRGGNGFGVKSRRLDAGFVQNPRRARLCLLEQTLGVAVGAPASLLYLALGLGARGLAQPIGLVGSGLVKSSGLRRRDLVEMGGLGRGVQQLLRGQANIGLGAVFQLVGLGLRRLP